MGKSALSRAAEWLRRTLPHSSSAPAPRFDEGDLALAAGDLRLLEFLANDLSDRAQSLRGAMRALDPAGSAAGLGAYQQSVEEIDRLDELAHSVSALVHESKSGEPLVAVDLEDPIRRALARHGHRHGGSLGMRVSAPARLPRVMAKPPALVRTLALCFEASTLAANEGPIQLHLSNGGDDDRVNAVFRPSNARSILAPKIRERLHTALALATRFASTFGAEVQVDGSGAALVPRLRLLPEARVAL